MQLRCATGLLCLVTLARTCTTACPPPRGHAAACYSTCVMPNCKPCAPRRYEDNGDSVNNLTVIVQKTDKTSIEQYGAPDKFLGDVSFLLGEQVFKGARRARGCTWGMQAHLQALGRVALGLPVRGL